MLLERRLRYLISKLTPATVPYWLWAVLIVSVSVVTAGATASWVQRPEKSDVAPSSLPLELPATAVVVEMDLTEHIVGFGSVVDLSDGVQLKVGDGKVVTDTSRWNGRPDDLLTELNGRPLFVMSSEFPLWRDIGPGDVGRDVEAVEKWLHRTGFLSVTPNDKFDHDTSRALQAHYKNSGYVPPSAVGVDEVHEIEAAVQQAVLSVESAERELRDFEEDEAKARAAATASAEESQSSTASVTTITETDSSKFDDVAAARQLRDLKQALDQARVELRTLQDELSNARARSGIPILLDEITTVPPHSVWHLEDPLPIGHVVKDGLITLSRDSRTQFVQMDGDVDNGDVEVGPSTNSEVITTTSGCALVETSTVAKVVLGDGTAMTGVVVGERDGLCEIGGLPDELEAGVRVRLELILGSTGPGAKVVPINAIYERPDGLSVRVVDSDESDLESTLVSVKLGVRQGDLVQILSDELEPGATVLVR